MYHLHNQDRLCTFRCVSMEAQTSRKALRILDTQHDCKQGKMIQESQSGLECGMYEDDAAAALCRAFSLLKYLGLKCTYCGEDQVIRKDSREQKDCQSKQ
jgi:hypothetical protein